MPSATATPQGTVLTDTIVPPGEPWSAVVPQGQSLRLIDLEGTQAVDFLCYNAHDPAERYCAADTMKIAGSIYLEAEVTLYSQPRQPALHHRRGYLRAARYDRRMLQPGEQPGSLRRRRATELPR